MAKYRFRSGLASVLALIFLVMFTVLCIAYTSTTSMGFVQATNQVRSHAALLQAESGLSYLCSILRAVSLPGNATGQSLMDKLGTDLPAMIGQDNLGSGSITCQGTAINLPAISTDSGGSFVSTLSLLPDDKTLRVKVTGQYQDLRRTVSMDLRLVWSEGSEVFNYGVATKSTIYIDGSGKISSTNYLPGTTLPDRSEADVLCANATSTTAVTLHNSGTIDGQLFLTNPNCPSGRNGTVSLSGSPYINGVNLWDSKSIYDGVFPGVAPVSFPEVDSSSYVPLATNIISTPVQDNQTLSNIRIKANTNPTFTGVTNITGVIYVEAPNKVTFSNQTRITGVIVTQDAGDNVYASNYIRFIGDPQLAGVEQLPNTAQFSTLRTLAGSAILAPGFSLLFDNGFSAVGGTIAAEAITITGGATGTIKGNMIIYGNSSLSLTRGASIKIDRSSGREPPPGFIAPSLKLLAQSPSYQEN